MQNPKQSLLLLFIIIISIVLSVAATLAVIKVFSPIRKLAYIETSRLLVGYSEADAANKELKAADEKWQKQFTAMKDSLQTLINPLSAEYEKAPAARKKEIEILINTFNQQLSTAQQENAASIQKSYDEKMKVITQKIDQYISEYGKRHHYDFIFGTLQGTITYANSSAVDVTDEIIKGLNERYK